MFDPFVEIGEDFLDEPALTLFRKHVRPKLVARWGAEKGKRPHQCRPTWSLPAGAGRGRPVSAGGVRIPHTRLAIGGRSTSTGAVAAVSADRYNRRHEAERIRAAERAAAVAPAGAVLNDTYLNRLEQSAMAGGALSAMRTNMEQDPARREHEWTARTRHERKAGKPRININADRDPALCAIVAADPRWPEQLRIAIGRDLALAKAGGARTKSKLAGEPWIDADADAVHARLCEAYGLRRDAKDAALSFGAPRAGRVFYSWIAELPRELDEARRQAYLDGMARSLDMYGLSYVLVMHRPDPLNHPDNHHLHLMYSDRPVASLADGGFDIEQVVERDYGRGRRRDIHQRQPKVRAVSERGWAQLRSIHVEHCNGQLAAIGAQGATRPAGSSAPGSPSTNGRAS